MSVVDNNNNKNVCDLILSSRVKLEVLALLENYNLTRSSSMTLFRYVWEQQQKQT